MSSRTYELDGKRYDIAKLDEDAQGIFSLLVTAKKQADEHREQLIILTEAYSNFALRLNAKCVDEALIEHTDKEVGILGPPEPDLYMNKV